MKEPFLFHLPSLSFIISDTLQNHHLFNCGARFSDMIDRTVNFTL